MDSIERPDSSCDLSQASSMTRTLVRVPDGTGASGTVVRRTKASRSAAGRGPDGTGALGWACRATAGVETGRLADGTGGACRGATSGDGGSGRGRPGAGRRGRGLPLRP